MDCSGFRSTYRVISVLFHIAVVVHIVFFLYQSEMKGVFLNVVDVEVDHQYYYIIMRGTIPQHRSECEYILDHISVNG